MDFSLLFMIVNILTCQQVIFHLSQQIVIVHIDM